MNTEPLTQDRLLELFDYDGKALIWRERPLSDFKSERYKKTSDIRFSGKPAGTRKALGYIGVRVDGQNYLAHRLIFLHQHGFLPKEIDHINGVRNDNRLENLRAADRVANGRNQKLFMTNTSGRIGVGWYKPKNRWRANIRGNGNLIYFRIF